MWSASSRGRRRYYLSGLFSFSFFSVSLQLLAVVRGQGGGALRNDAPRPAGATRKHIVWMFADGAFQTVCRLPDCSCCRALQARRFTACTTRLRCDQQVSPASACRPWMERRLAPRQLPGRFLSPSRLSSARGRDLAHIHNPAAAPRRPRAQQRIPPSRRGPAQIPTPAIDALASGGALLEHYYVQPVCSPSRATLLTGRHVIHTGVYHGASTSAASGCVKPGYYCVPQCAATVSAVEWMKSCALPAGSMNSE